MFSNYLAFPFVAAALIILYVSWEVDEAYAPWMVPFIVLAAVIFVFSPQINWWWYSRRPPALLPRLREMLERCSRFYQQLDAAGQQKFRDRVALFRMGTDWMPKGWPDETLAPDIELALAAQAVMLTFNRPKFVFEKFEKVIVYPSAFPTPEYPFAHASEVFAPDGCLLFSAEQVMAAFIDPAKWYNVGLHEYAKVFMLTYPDENYPTLDPETIWQQLEAVSGMSRERVEAIIGLAGVDPLPVAIHHYFSFPEQFRSVLPEIYHSLDQNFQNFQNEQNLVG